MKRIFLVLSIFAMFFCFNCVYASQDVNVVLNKGLKIFYNNEIQEFKNVNGQRVYPISYEGTTYLPIRSISSIFNIRINWNQKLNAVELGEGELDKISAQSIENFIAEPTENIQVLLNDKIRVSYDGMYQTFKDVNENEVYPLSYQGTTYLPVRAISNLFDIKIKWDGNTNSVILDDTYRGITPSTQIPELPKESFASEAKVHTDTPALKGQAGTVNLHSGTGLDENGNNKILMSSLHLKMKEIYSGNTAIEIIEDYNNAFEKAGKYNIAFAEGYGGISLFPKYTINENKNLYCALFDVDLTDIDFPFNSTSTFSAVKPEVIVSAYDLKNALEGSTRATIIPREIKKQYCEGDLTQFYVVFETPNDFEFSSVEIKFLNETDYTYELFFANM